MKSKLLLLIPLFIAYLAITGAVNAQGTPTLGFDPDPKTVLEEDIGETFTVDLTITNVTDLWGWRVRITWNSSVINYTDATEGPFLSSVGTTLFPPPQIEVGEIEEMSCLFMLRVGATGSGTLATINFTALALGETDLNLLETVLLDRDIDTDIGDPLAQYHIRISHDANPGHVTVIPEFPASMILPLFMIITTAIAIMAKKVWSRKPRGYINTQ